MARPMLGMLLLERLPLPSPPFRPAHAALPHLHALPIHSCWEVCDCRAARAAILNRPPTCPAGAPRTLRVEGPAAASPRVRLCMMRRILLGHWQSLPSWRSTCLQAVFARGLLAGLHCWSGQPAFLIPALFHASTPWPATRVVLLPSTAGSSVHRLTSPSESSAPNCTAALPLTLSCLMLPPPRGPRPCLHSCRCFCLWHGCAGRGWCRPSLRGELQRGARLWPQPPQL